MKVILTLQAVDEIITDVNIATDVINANAELMCTQLNVTPQTVVSEVVANFYMTNYYKGDPGVGVPTGGTTSQVLKKKSNDDYDTEWANESGGGSSVIEHIEVNNVELPIVDKTVNIQVPTQASDIGAEPANNNIQEHISDTDIHHSTEDLNNSFEPKNSNIQSHISDNDIHHSSQSLTDAFEPKNSNIQEHIADDTIHHTTTELDELYEPKKGTDDNYVTDDEKTKLSNLSGVNTGDQDLTEINSHLGDATKHINTNTEFSDTIDETNDKFTIWDNSISKWIKFSLTSMYNWLKGKFDLVYSAINHNHNLNDLTEKSYNNLTDKPDLSSLHTHANKTDLDNYDPTDFAAYNHTHTGTYEPANNNIQSHIGNNDIHVTTTDKSNWNGKQDALGYTPENVSNKENTTIDTSTTKYPTVNLLKTGLDAKQNSLGYTPENVSNKKTSLTDNSDTYYPTQKAVKTAVDAKQDTLVSATNIKTINGESVLGAGNLTISGTGEVNTASNLGTGEGVYASKSGVDLRFKSLKAGTNVTLSSNTNEITINSSGGGGGDEVDFSVSRIENTTGSETLYNPTQRKFYLLDITNSASTYTITISRKPSSGGTAAYTNLEHYVVIRNTNASAKTLVIQLETTGDKMDSEGLTAVAIPASGIYEVGYIWLQRGTDNVCVITKSTLLSETTKA